MSTPLIPQEIYLLERYSSLEYFGEMREHFAACVKAAEDALAEFMRHLPADYRALPLHQQPDAVWGERVIPNMQWALKGLNNGYIRLAHGDLDGLRMAGNLESTFAAINRDYPFDWMPEPFLSQFEEERISSWERASNIFDTEQCNWTMGDLSFAYHTPSRGPLNPPHSWPVYRLNPSVQVRTGSRVPRSGIYLPAVDHAAAALLIEGQETVEAEVSTNVAERLRDPENSMPESRRDPTLWTLIERVADEGGGVPGEEAPADATRLRCEAGQSCPREGWWFTPANPGSRRHFKQGEVMPALGGDYGQTIWQWDERQA